MRNLLEYLENSKENNSQKIAVIDENGTYTYEELEDLSKSVGNGLSQKVKSQNPIPILMEKGRDALVAFFGTVYAGCYYVLLNPELPVDRLKKIMTVLEVEYLVTDRKHFEYAKELTKMDSILLIEDLKQTSIDEKKLKQIREKMLDIDPLYVNFTSGSTGNPKGVVVSHKAVIDFIDNFTQIFNIKNDDIIANQAPFDFDVSVKDIYSTICKGATLVIVPKRLFVQPTQLLDFLCENNVTTMIWAVSALCLITTFHALDYKTPKTVDKILFSGEVMPIKHLKQWIQHLPNAMFVNLYGPTEITCNCTYYIIDNKKEYEKIPLGKTFPNEEVFLLDDENKKIIEDSIKGEICVRGICLALGYYNNPKYTESNFVQNPLNNKYIDIIYKTGDLGYYLDGELFFAGRKDFQIKHMGHRIELEEIEKSIETIDGIKRCCCIYDYSKSRINGFYIGNIEKEKIFNYLKDKLPYFMIPNTLTQKEIFPITKNGKVDRKKLGDKNE